MQRLFATDQRGLTRILKTVPQLSLLPLSRMYLNWEDLTQKRLLLAMGVGGTTPALKIRVHPCSSWRKGFLRSLELATWTCFLRVVGNDLLDKLHHPGAVFALGGFVGATL